MPLILTQQVRGGVTLLIVLDDNAMARIGERDPFEIATADLPPPQDSMHVVGIGVVYASESDLAEILRLVQDNKPGDAIRYAIRGHKLLAAEGDGNAPIRITDLNKQQGN
jgi:hypothetical protein